VTIDENDADGNAISVASRSVHTDKLGFVLIWIGDFETENILLDPLAKSVLQFMRLLVEDAVIHYWKIRKVSELEFLWAKNADAASHVIFLGHGAHDSLRFTDREERVTGKQLGEILLAANSATRPKVFLSLACLTGRASFAREFSKSPVCREFFGPFQSVHGAVASQYAQNVLAFHLLDGLEMAAAHRNAGQLAGGSHFRRWKDGLQKGSGVSSPAKGVPEDQAA